MQTKRSSSSSRTSDREANILPLPCSQLIFFVWKPHQLKPPGIWMLFLIRTSAFVPTFQQSVGHAVTISGIWGVYAAISLLVPQNYLHTPWSPADWITAILFYLVLLTRRLFSFNVFKTPWLVLLLRNHLWPAVFHYYAPFTGCQ